MTPAPAQRLDRCVTLALACVDRRYPYQLVRRIDRAGDVAAPHVAHPVFHGCYDWHSAVHAHWLLARAAHVAPETDSGRAAADALHRRLAPGPLAAEAAHLAAHPTFERPYGLAWLLTLDAELHALSGRDDAAAVCAEALAPAVAAAVRHLAGWLPALTHPVRVGTHAQTAFAMSLALDWSRRRGQRRFERLVGNRALAFHLQDRDLPLHLEPSGEDFLSPSLGAADLLRRLLAPGDLAAWLDVALPGLDPGALAPGRVADPTDGRLAHLDGLNLSRAWMLRGIAGALPSDDARRAGLEAAAARHAEAGLESLDGEHYAGTHWLGTFAAYLTTGAWNVPASGVSIGRP